MAGTHNGGKSAARANKERYGDDFYCRIGRIGGAKSKTGGFASEEIGHDGMTGRERASMVGRIGGRKSKKSGPNKKS